MLLETATKLGPAKVTEVAGPELRLIFQDESVSASLAMSYPYEPAVGDTVLAIGNGEAFFVIGVIQGTGNTAFTAPGNLEFRAPWGSIDFVSPKGIRMRGGTISLQAKNLKLAARTVVEKFDEAIRKVKDLFQLHAGSVRKTVSGKYALKAGRIVNHAEKDVHIDGNSINLG